MRKELFLGIIGLIVVVFFVASCVPVAKYYVCPDGSQVKNPANCPVVQDEKEQEPEEPQTIIEEIQEEIEEVFEEKIISEEAAALFSKITGVKGLQYSYVESPEVLPQNTYFTSREKMKVELKTKVRYSPDDSYDTVYLDLVEKTAVAYCENKDRQTCPDRDKAYRVEFDDYFIETPFDWLGKVTSADLTGRSQSIEQRNAAEVSFEIDEASGVMFIDAYYGVPLTITFGNKQYEFRDIVINEVDDEDLDHQFET